MKKYACIQLIFSLSIILLNLNAQNTKPINPQLTKLHQGQQIPRPVSKSTRLKKNTPYYNLRHGAALTSHRGDGSEIISSSSQRFTWQHIPGASYFISLGTSRGASDLRAIGTDHENSLVIDSIPPNQGIFYLRISSYFKERWWHRDYRFRSMTIAQLTADSDLDHSMFIPTSQGNYTAFGSDYLQYYIDSNPLNKRRQQLYALDLDSYSLSQSGPQHITLNASSFFASKNGQINFNNFLHPHSSELRIIAQDNIQLHNISNHCHNGTKTTGGNITLQAKTIHISGTISTSEPTRTNSAGNISLEAGDGSLIVDKHIDTAAQQAGNIELTASDSITIKGDLLSYEPKGINPAAAIFISSAHESVYIQGQIDSSSTSPGDLHVEAAKDIIFHQLDFSKLGQVSLSAEQRIAVLGPITGLKLLSPQSVQANLRALNNHIYYFEDQNELSGSYRIFDVHNQDTSFQLKPVPIIDSDQDGVSDHLDAFPYDPKESKDSDRDGIGNNREITDGTDPYDPNSLDTDRDGIADASDTDIDGDSLIDTWEVQHYGHLNKQANSSTLSGLSAQHAHDLGINPHFPIINTIPPLATVHSPLGSF